MKKIILSSLFLILTVIVKAQNLPYDSLTRKVVYSEVVQVDSASKNDLYLRCRAWFAKTFLSANNVIQMDDKEAGRIIGRAATKSSFVYFLVNFKFTLYYTIAVTIKDGRYKYELSDFIAQDDATQYNSGFTYKIDQLASGRTENDIPTKKDNGQYKAVYRGYIVATYKQAELMSESLKLAMAVKGKFDDF
jgi:hypothetical protein